MRAKTCDNGRVTGRVRVHQWIAGKLFATSGWSKNLVVNGTSTGKNLISQRLGGDNTYTMNVKYGEIGTGNTTPADTDAALAIPQVRAGSPTIVVSGGVVTFQFFFSDATLPNNTYKEFGLFVDGNASLGTGQLFARALFDTPYTKTSGTDTTVEYEISIG